MTVEKAVYRSLAVVNVRRTGLKTYMVCFFTEAERFCAL